jgi:hypothetical protein
MKNNLLQVAVQVMHNGASQFARQIARRPCTTNSKIFDFVSLTVDCY